MLYSKTDDTGCSPALDAATVILVRERPGKPFEIFLMRRNANQSFMGGAYVFPGGKVDRRDTDDSLSGHRLGPDGPDAARMLNEPDLAVDRARGLFFAALREVFEESGVLLAVRTTGESVDFRDAAVAARCAAYREDVHNGKCSLLEIARAEDLRYDLTRLAPYAHWITPQIESKRFDTRFFLARIPEGQTAVHDDIELVDSVWISPADALAQQRAGEILLMPPTLKTMEELAAHGSADELFAFAARRPIRPILPQFRSCGERFMILLPHDPEYGIGEYKQPHRSGEASRVVMSGGRWRTECVDGSVLGVGAEPEGD